MHDMKSDESNAFVRWLRSTGKFFDIKHVMAHKIPTDTAAKYVLCYSK